MRTFVVWFNVVLILSMHPLHAARVAEQERVLESSGVEAAVTDLQQAAQEAVAEVEAAMHAHHGTENDHEWWWSDEEAKPTCETRQKNFERHSHNLNRLVNNSLSDGFLDIYETSSILLGMKDIAKLVKRAGKAKCEWSKDGKVDITPLTAVVQMTARASPCYTKAKELMDNMSGNISASENKEALVKATTMLLSPTCETGLETGLDSSGQHPQEILEENVDSLEELADIGAADLSDVALESASDLAKGGSLFQVGATGNNLAAMMIVAIFSTAFCLVFLLGCVFVGSVAEVVINAGITIWALTWCTLKAAMWSTIKFFTGLAPNWNGGFMECWSGYSSVPSMAVGCMRLGMALVFPYH